MTIEPTSQKMKRRASVEPASKVTIADLQAKKRAGQKIVGVVAWDYQMARVADRAGVDLISVGDSVGVNLWGRHNPLDVRIEEMLIVAQAVRHGVERALVSCDFPFGPLQEGADSAVRAAVHLIRDAGVDLVKLDDAASFPEAVAAVTSAGMPVIAQFGITPQSAGRYGIAPGAVNVPGTKVPTELEEDLVEQAKQLEAAGASLLDFTNSGPAAGLRVAQAVSIPVLGGLGGGPWLDGRIRMLNAAIGYAASFLDAPRDSYANVARVAFDAITAYADDVRAGREVKGDRRH